MGYSKDYLEELRKLGLGKDPKKVTPNWSSVDRAAEALWDEARRQATSEHFERVFGQKTNDCEDPANPASSEDAVLVKYKALVEERMIAPYSTEEGRKAAEGRRQLQAEELLRQALGGNIKLYQVKLNEMFKQKAIK